MVSTICTTTMALFLAQPLPPDQAAALAPALGARGPETGVIRLGENLAELEVPANMVFLGPEGAAAFLTETWGNPPDQGALGLLAPAAAGDDRAISWAVVLFHEDVGHVADDEAGELDPEQMLVSLQRDAVAADPERAEAGQPPLRIGPWAVPPRYDADRHQLVWATDLYTLDGDADGDAAPAAHTLNYQVRVLGREGMLALYAVADASDLPAVTEMMAALLPHIGFVAGERYDDFDAKSGRRAAVGLAAIVAGTAVAKTGLLKGFLVALLLVLKKLVVVPVVAAVSWTVGRLRRAAGARHARARPSDAAGEDV